MTEAINQLLLVKRILLRTLRRLEKKGQGAGQDRINRALQELDIGIDLVAELDEPDLPPPPDQGEFAGIILVEEDISSWPKTRTLSTVLVQGETIFLDFDNDWPVINGVSGNPWVVFEQDGQWYATTWEWFGPGQTEKSPEILPGQTFTEAFVAHAMKPVPNSVGSLPPTWNLNPGDLIGFFATTPARGPERTVNERTNIRWVPWPEDASVSS